MTTERDLLDALWARLSRPSSPGMPSRYVMAEHVRYSPAGGYRIADALAVDTWGSGDYQVEGYEVKTHRADWLRELRDPSKAETWRQHCARWYVLTVPDVVRHDELPAGWGLIVRRRTTMRCEVPSSLTTSPEPLAARQVAGLMRAVQATAVRHHTARPLTTPAPPPPPTGRCTCTRCTMTWAKEGACGGPLTAGHAATRCFPCSTLCPQETTP